MSARALPLVVFYDADCGFCSHSAAVLSKLDRRGRLDLMPLDDAASAFHDAPPQEQLMELMHVRDASGQWFVGGRAWLRITDELPLLRPLGWIGRLPLVRHLVDPVYALVARNRHNLSRLLGDDACSIAPARR
jgi:predicted DCC family thiol-disulfide oxidoreductase YuxK